MEGLDKLYMEYLEKLDAETLKTELISFIDEVWGISDITSFEEFVDEFVEYIKEDLSRNNG